MTWNGTPVIKKVSDTCFRLTGVSLDDGDTGTVGFSEGTVPAEVLLVAPDWDPLGDVTLQDAIWVTMNPVTDEETAIPIRVVKTGTTHEDFLITFTNDVAEMISPGLEIYIHWR